jgi:hypothetical protein
MAVLDLGGGPPKPPYFFANSASGKCWQAASLSHSTASRMVVIERASATFGLPRTAWKRRREFHEIAALISLA